MTRSVECIVVRQNERRNNGVLTAHAILGHKNVQ